jgi:hypothetical protein
MFFNRNNREVAQQGGPEVEWWAARSDENIGYLE